MRISHKNLCYFAELFLCLSSRKAKTSQLCNVHFWDLCPKSISNCTYSLSSGVNLMPKQKKVFRFPKWGNRTPHFLFRIHFGIDLYFILQNHFVPLLRLIWDALLKNTPLIRLHLTPGCRTELFPNSQK